MKRKALRHKHGYLQSSSKPGRNGRCVIINRMKTDLRKILVKTVLKIFIKDIFYTKTSTSYLSHRVTTLNQFKTGFKINKNI